MKTALCLLLLLVFVAESGSGQITPVKIPAGQKPIAPSGPATPATQTKLPVDIKPTTPVNPILQQMLVKAREKNLGAPDHNIAVLFDFYGGYMSKFEQGVVYYHESFGLHAVSTAMDRYREFSERGFPLTDEMQEGSNRYQVFERMVKYYSLENTAIRNWEFKEAAYPTITAPATAKRSGVYKFTVLGFTCNHPTNDDILERDGKGDEVYIICNSYQQHADNNLVLVQRSRTKVHGDVNSPDWIAGPHERIRVGSKSAFGGIKEGDSYPAVPYQLNGSPNYLNAEDQAQLPYVLSQIYLQEDGDKAVFIPVLWEKDNDSEPSNDFLYFLSVPGVSDFVNYVAGNANDAILHSGDNTRPQLNYMHDILFTFPDRNNGSNVTVTKSIVGDPHDRPVGMYDAGDHFRFNPIVIKLGYQQAEQLVNTDPLGAGKGVFKIDYTDDPALAGSYTLYFKIEKLN